MPPESEEEKKAREAKEAAEKAANADPKRAEAVSVVADGFKKAWKEIQAEEKGRGANPPDRDNGTGKKLLDFLGLEW